MQPWLRTFLTLSALSIAALACGPQASSTGDVQAAPAVGSDAIPTTALCQHVRDVAAKDSDDAEALDTIQRDCVAVMTKLEPRYANFTKCVDQAQTGDEIARCEQAMVAPPPLLLGAGSAGGVAAVCDHMLQILQKDLAAAGAMSLAELSRLRQQCIEKASKEIEVQGQETFAKKADCILAAQSLADIEGCDPNR